MKENIFEKSIDILREVWYTLVTIKKEVIKMIIETKKTKEVELRMLEYGEVFEWQDCIFMFMPTITDHEEDQFNAIDLSCGYVEDVPLNAKVIPHPKAKLIIEE
jgi:hypothetical protein